jgi:hypothetical protein
MPLPREQAWFAAKTYGWGWGVPLRWQGWIAMICFVIAISAGAPLARDHIGAFAAYCFTMSLAFVALCYWKGEAPRWRWGRGDR